MWLHCLTTVDLVEVYTSINSISDVDKDKFFTVSNYTATRGHSLNFAKIRHRLKVRSNTFSIRVIVSWNSLPESVIRASSLNFFRSRFNSHWKFHPCKVNPWCYDPGPKTKDYSTFLIRYFRCHCRLRLQ